LRGPLGTPAAPQRGVLEGPREAGLEGGGRLPPSLSVILKNVENFAIL
jgi:hypothetical protein